jgi:type III pantothenate kinase
MLLAFDIGNTNIVIGGFAKERLLFEYRLKSDPERTVDEYAALLYSLFEREMGSKYEVEGAIVCSVVPPITPDICKLLITRFNVEPRVIGPGVKTGLNIKMPDPKSVGSDRVVNAVAVKEFFGAPSLVIDFGTATSFDYVSPEGSYEGGLIVPGLVVSLDSLVKRTAKLPRIEVSIPDKVVGTSTVEAMSSGIMLGYLSLVDGLIERIEQEKGQIKYIVSTGGLGELLSGHLKRKITYDRHLTLKGLKLIYEINQ